jgi:hypothetical protein
MQIELPSWAGQAMMAIVTALVSAIGGWWAGRKDKTISVPELRYVIAWGMASIGALGLVTNAGVYVTQVFQLYNNFPEALPYWSAWGTAVSVAMIGGGATAYYAK